MVFNAIATAEELPTVKRGHITNLLDREAVRDLTPGDCMTVEAHCVKCADCRNAYFAAIAAHELITAHSVQLFEPSPFFATRVMAVIRERGARQESTFAAGVIAATSALRTALTSMILVVTLLFSLTLYFGGNEVGYVDQSSDARASSEPALLDEEDGGDDLSDFQVISILYGPADSDEQNR
jgi:hypothetical protein